MITEEQARTLLAGEPTGSLDAERVLAAGRRSLRRRRMAYATGTAVAAGVTAVAVLSAGSAPPATLRPAATTPPAARSYGEPVVLRTYTDAEGPKEIVAFFRAGQNPRVWPDRTPATDGISVCTVTRAPGAAFDPDRAGCSYPAINEGSHVGGAASLLAPGEPKRTPLIGASGLLYVVVSRDVASGAVFDENGDPHEGRVVGREDPDLPALFLLVDIGDHAARGTVVRDANGDVLQQDGPFRVDGVSVSPGIPRK